MSVQVKLHLRDLTGLDLKTLIIALAQTQVLVGRVAA